MKTKYYCQPDRLQHNVKCVVIQELPIKDTDCVLLVIAGLELKGTATAGGLKFMIVDSRNVYDDKQKEGT